MFTTGILRANRIKLYRSVVKQSIFSMTRVNHVFSGDSKPNTLTNGVHQDNFLRENISCSVSGLTSKPMPNRIPPHHLRKVIVFLPVNYVLRHLIWYCDVCSFQLIRTPDSELFCLCCVAALKSLPALSFKALIFPILRIVCTISFH